ncbi:MAG: Dolichol kinase [Bacteroidetes bacterium]|nr:Dolichol kinase [Bacteroidota bacterium]
MNDLPNVEQSYGVELVRKAIHLCSLSIPIVYSFISQSTALAILVPLTLVVGLADLARLFHPPVGHFYYEYFGWLLRAHERDGERRRLNGATYVLLSATLCVVIFPKLIVITAFSILIISDTLAALVGRKFGRHQFLGKSLEGTAAFFLSALVVVLITPKVEYLFIEYLIGGFGALSGAVVEAISIAVDDNLSIPLSIGAVMWLLYLFLAPGIQITALDKLL